MVFRDVEGVLELTSGSRSGMKDLVVQAEEADSASEDGTGE